MSHEENRRKDLSDFEADLASLTPRPAQLDRDRLLFLAGRAAALAETRSERESVAAPFFHRNSWWSMGAASLAGAAVVFFVMLGLRPGPQTIVQYVVPAPPDSSAAQVAVDLTRAAEVQPPADARGNAFASTADPEQRPTYAETRSFILRHGVDAWIGTRSSDGPASEGYTSCVYVAQAPTTQQQLMQEMLDELSAKRKQTSSHSTP